LTLLEIDLLLLALCFLLLRWKPPAASAKRVLRDCGIFTLGSIVVLLSLRSGLRAIGLGEYAAGQSLTYLVVGLGYAIGSATKAPIFWTVHSNWFLWSFLSERRKQELGVILGVVLFAGGMAMGRQERTAYRICTNWYVVARTAEDSARIADAAPDPRLRRPQGRFATQEGPALTCRDILR
jgi:hypothetical protein